MAERLLCIGDGTTDCRNVATWFRCTQFAGDHPLCEEHARQDPTFGSGDDWHHVWKRIGLPRADRRELIQAGKFRVLDVLAGAYKNRHSLCAGVQHVLVDGDDRTLCRRVLAERLSDIGPEVPTCPECVRRLARARGAT